MVVSVLPTCPKSYLDAEMTFKAETTARVKKTVNVVSAEISGAGSPVVEFTSGCSAMMAGGTQRDLLVVIIGRSMRRQDFTCSSTRLGWCRMSACFKCTCVILCTKLIMALSFMSC